MQTRESGSGAVSAAGRGQGQQLPAGTRAPVCVTAHSPGPIALTGSDHTLPPHQVTVAAELICVTGHWGSC